jgi:hypothetical protein
MGFRVDSANEIVVMKVRRTNVSICARDTATHSMFRSFHCIPLCINLPNFVIA